MLPLHIFSMFLFLRKRYFNACNQLSRKDFFFMLGRKQSHSVFYLNDEDVSITRPPTSFKTSTTTRVKSYMYNIDFDAKYRNSHESLQLYLVELQWKYLVHPRITA
jgi:hypothetical protein